MDDKMNVLKIGAKLYENDINICWNKIFVTLNIKLWRATLRVKNF